MSANTPPTTAAPIRRLRTRWVFFFGRIAVLSLSEASAIRSRAALPAAVTLASPARCSAVSASVPAALCKTWLNPSAPRCTVGSAALPAPRASVTAWSARSLIVSAARPRSSTAALERRLRMLQQTSVLTCRCTAPHECTGTKGLILRWLHDSTLRSRRGGDGSGGGGKRPRDVAETDRRGLASERRIQRRVEEPPDARRRNRPDQPGQLRFRGAVDRPEGWKGTHQLDERRRLQPVDRGEMAHATPGERSGLIGIEGELELDGADGHGSSLPNGCSTCQIGLIVRTLVGDASL